MIRSGTLASGAAVARLTAFAALAIAAVLATPAIAASRQVTVVELFTSQGCSSVPPANRNLIALGGRPDLLPLSFSVTYWDHLGWKDTFGDEAFTARQRSYERGLGHDGPFTPQIVINGARDTVGNQARTVRSLVSTADQPASVAIAITDRSVEIGRADAPAPAADVWLLHYRPGVQNVAIARGENAGTTLPVGNVVTDIRRLGRWQGTAMSLAMPAAKRGLKTAVIVQAPGGAILSAATD